MAGAGAFLESGGEALALRRLRIKVGERWHTVEVEDTSTSPVKVVVDGEAFLVELEGSTEGQGGVQALSPQAVKEALTAAPSVVAEKVLRSPMPGRVLTVSVKEGGHVAPGDEVCIVEAMKMHQSIRFSQEGKVKKVHIRPGQQVNTGDLLVELE